MRGWAAVLGSWVAGRAVVGLAALVAVLAVSHGARLPHRVGLRVYDGTFYAQIAAHGYGAHPGDVLRFFPLDPLLARAVDVLLPGGSVAATLVVSGLAALGYLALLHRLVVQTGGVPAASATAGRAVWLVALAPAAATLVLGYAEALAGLLAVGVFLALRRDAFLAAVPLGLLAGLDRPTGLLLAVPVAVQAWRARGAPRPARMVAVLAPLAGCAAYLLWVGAVYGDPLAPYRAQTQGGLRGSLVSLPAAPLKHSLVVIAHGPRTAADVVTALHLAWVLLALVLLVVCARRLPVTWTCWAAVSVAAALTARTLDSFERYSLGVFPLAVALALLVHRRVAWLAVAVLAGVVSTGYATLALLERYTP